jgi:hypothetical protein
VVTCRLGTIAAGKHVKLKIPLRAGTLHKGMKRKTVTTVLTVTSSTPEFNPKDNKRKLKTTVVRG